VRNRIVVLAAATCGVALALVAACPLPQPLAGVTLVDGGKISPPRILTASVNPSDTPILLAQDCPTGSTLSLSATIDDDNTTEAVEARWFIDYDPAANPGVAGDEQLEPETGTDTTRAVTPFAFPVPAYSASKPVHIVELVVSNGFLPQSDMTGPLPHREPLAGYEVQLYRWVFEYATTGGRCH